MRGRVAPAAGGVGAQGSWHFRTDRSAPSTWLQTKEVAEEYHVEGGWPATDMRTPETQMRMKASRSPTQSISQDCFCSLNSQLVTLFQIYALFCKTPRQN